MDQDANATFEISLAFFGSIYEGWQIVCLTNYLQEEENVQEIFYVSDDICILDASANLIPRSADNTGWAKN